MRVSDSAENREDNPDHEQCSGKRTDACDGIERSSIDFLGQVNAHIGIGKIGGDLGLLSCMQYICNVCDVSNALMPGTFTKTLPDIESCRSS